MYGFHFWLNVIDTNCYQLFTMPCSAPIVMVLLQLMNHRVPRPGYPPPSMELSELTNQRYEFRHVDSCKHLASQF